MILNFDDFLLFESFQINPNLDYQPGNEFVNLILGRFQPFHLGHLSIAKFLYSQNKLKTLIIVIIGEKSTSKNSIFPKNLIDKVIKDIVNAEKQLFVGFQRASSGNLIEIIYNIRPKFEPALIGSGNDRFDSYKRQIDTIKQKYPNFNLSEQCKVINLERNFNAGGFIATISGAKVREAIKNDDFEYFKNATHPVIHKYFDEFKKYLK